MGRAVLVLMLLLSVLCRKGLKFPENGKTAEDYVRKRVRLLTER